MSVRPALNAQVTDQLLGPGMAIRIRQISPVLRPFCLDARGRLSGQTVHVIDAKDFLGLIPMVQVGRPAAQNVGSGVRGLALEPAGWVLPDAIEA